MSPEPLAVCVQAVQCEGIQRSTVHTGIEGGKGKTAWGGVIPPLPFLKEPIMSSYRYRVRAAV